MATVKEKLFEKLFKRKSKAAPPPREPTEPWRKYSVLDNGWDKKYCKTLLEDIEETAKGAFPDSESTVNILMLGYIQSGKSSTINSIFCITAGKLSTRAKCGESTTSFTQKYVSYLGQKELKRILFFDVMGIELGQNQGLQNPDIGQCMDGSVEEDYHFNPCSPKTQKEENGSNSTNTIHIRQKEQKEKREIHCVMYCVDAETIFDEIVPGFEHKMQEIETYMKVNVQDRIVLVTKIDAICETTREDIKQIFYSEKIQKVVEKAASVFRVNKNHVFPIKNYIDEMEIDEYKNIPILLALKTAVDFGTDYLRDKADKAKRCGTQTPSGVIQNEQHEQQTEI